MEAEVAGFVGAYAHLTDSAGRRRIVRHGHFPEREIQTGIGPVAVRCPRVRDRGAGETGPPIRFTSRFLPPFLRRAKSIEEHPALALSEGHLHGRFLRGACGALGARGARALAVNQEEAEIVRTIFRAYVDLGSVHALQRWLEDRGIRSKRRVTRAGRLSGGRPFSRGALFQLLRNRVYRGMIVHKGRAHPGRHQAIIDGDLFEAVQARLDANTRRRASNREQKANAPLAGRLFDADGWPMSPTFSCGRGGKLYRYYVSAPLQQGARRDPSDTAIRRISAPPLEVALATVLRRVIPGCPDDPITLVVRAELHDQSLHCLLPIDRIAAMRERLEPHERVEPDPADARLARLHLPLVRRRGETWVLKGPSAGHMPDPVLVKALRSAHAMLHHDDGGLPVLVTAPDTPYRRQLVRLAFLAPEIQRAIVEGRQSAGLTLAQLLKGPMPLAWPQQAVRIGIAASLE